MDAKFFSDMARGDENSWDRLILRVGVQNEFPEHFPLRYPRSMLSGLFLADSPRWKLAPK
jgi:hypothetical protein